MSKISLHAEGISDVTIVPNTFIDQFMPSANGSYVKVYLYLLRCFSGNCPEVTISSIADRLENTEKDIIRALSYWEKLNLLILTRNPGKEITAINLVDLNQIQKEYTIVPDIEPVAEEVAVSIQTEIKPSIHKSYSAEKISEFTNNDGIKWAMHIVEIYLDRPLKPMDLQLILYLYEELHFSAELIMYLFEYCVSKGKKNASYIEAVALTWAEEGIDTEEKAKVATTTHNDHFNTVNKAFGLNRAPGQIERQYITKWVEVFCFSDEIIAEACNRTILRTQKPDFKYTDKILETWFKKNVKSHTDITKLDEEFNKGNKTSETMKIAAVPKPSNNKFNQFPQRTYSAQDYADIERKLLNKNL
ncbi:MAG: DnaD domain protein [Herbinix sp.]|nr:DnaD domain protein [Herbinix sp.]